MSVLLGIYLGGHIASRGESTQDCVKIIFHSLCGASTDSQTNVPNLAAWDCRYGGPGGTINKMAVLCGCDLLGTAQCNCSFPIGQEPT